MSGEKLFIKIYSLYNLMNEAGKHPSFALSYDFMTNRFSYLHLCYIDFISIYLPVNKSYVKLVLYSIRPVT